MTFGRIFLCRSGREIARLPLIGHVYPAFKDGSVTTGRMSCHQSMTQSDLEKNLWPPRSIRLPR